MYVEVNEENIDRFALSEYTGNTREEMLSRAAEAAESGYVFGVNLPDTMIETNLFDVAESTPVEGMTNDRCRFERYTLNDPWRCIIHDGLYTGSQSIPEIDASCEATARAKERLAEGRVTPSMTCAYTKIDDPNAGTLYLCTQHDRTSRWDVAVNPHAPCLEME